MRTGTLIAIAASVVAAPIVAILVGIVIFLSVFVPGSMHARGANLPCVDLSLFDNDDGKKSLPVKTESGSTVDLEQKQLQNAAKILAVGSKLDVSRKGMVVAMVTALQESRLWMYANDTVEESLDFPHDQVGSDHDSLNEFQQRANWGSVKDRMDTTYAAKAFFGGDDGPNKGSPAGLLDIDGWEDMEPGKAAQKVQISAKPDAYAKWEDAAESIVEEFLGSGLDVDSSSASDEECDDDTATTASDTASKAAHPLNTPYSMTSGYGPRDSPTSGASSWHPAMDFVNPGRACGKTAFAMMDGEVTLSSALWLSIKSPDGFTISYLHMKKSERFVEVGDQVEASQAIGRVGSEGPSTGCHLDVRVNIAGNTNSAVKKADLDVSTEAPGGDWVNPEEFFKIFDLEICPAKWCSRP